MEPLGVALALSLWVLVGAGLYLLRRRSPFHLPTVALFATGLVGSFFPIASSFIEPASWRNLDYLSPRIVAEAQAEYVAFAFGLVAAVAIAAQARWTGREHVSRPSSAARDPWMAAGLVLAGLAMYGVYADRVGLGALLDRDDYALKYLVGQGLGPLQLGLPMAILGCLWAEASELPRATKNLYAALAAAIAIWSIAFISVRTNAVTIALGYASIFAWQRGAELRRVRPAVVVGLLALYAVLESFALFRGAYKGDVGDALALIGSQGERAFASAIGGSELSHPFVTTGEVLRLRDAGELGGRSLVDGVAACLPRGIHPERPLTLSEQFVRANYADLASRGGGAAFSFVAEGWLDFGSLFGPALFGLVLGLFLAWVERSRDLRPAGLVARMAPYFVLLVAMEHRNEFASMFKQVATLALVAVPLALLAEAIASTSLRNARARTH
jgi:hypothetical protein